MMKSIKEALKKGGASKWCDHGQDWSTPSEWERP
jgi:hypothetical protein